MSAEKEGKTSQSKGGDRSKTSRTSLPFEPKKNRKKAAETTPETPVKAEKKVTKKTPQTKSVKRTPISKEDKQIPKAVSQRMVRRMALLSGIPTVLGISTFFVSYWIVTQTEIKLPNTAVLLVSMACFGFGVLGLSYGVLSASWEEQAGSILGWKEFTGNFGRMTAAWRSVKEQQSIENSD